MRDGMEISRDFAQYLVTPLHVCNYSVQRTLQNLGWRISGARHSFHKWLHDLTRRRTISRRALLLIIDIWHQREFRGRQHAK